MVNEGPTSRHVDRFDSLTGIRYLAAVLVVLHRLAPAPPAFANFLATVGDGAVTLFFVLSGFVLFHSNVDAAGAMKKTKRQFWVARLARIYPLYALSFVVAGPMVIATTVANIPASLRPAAVSRSMRCWCWCCC